MVRHSSAWNILFILFLYFTSSMLFARPVSVEQARKVAGTFLKAENIRVEKKLTALQKKAIKQASPKKFTATSVKEIYSDGGETLAYVAELEPEGFIITAADDNIKPILGYSFKGKFPFQDSKQNVLLHLVQWDVQARLRALTVDTPEVRNLAQSNNNSWNTYTSGSEEFVQSLAGDPQTQWPDPDEYGYEGWITTNWHQGPPYNKFCPKDPFETDYIFKCPVGCTAVAVAQIINYWKYPSSIYFLDSEDEDSYISHGWNQWENQHYMFNIDNAALIYNFPDFPELNNKLLEIDYAGDVNETAYLCFGVGVKLEMQYSPHSSGTTVTDVYKDGLYYGSATHEYRSAELLWGVEWQERVIENVKKGWPAQIGLMESSNFPANAHTVIADGYKSTGEFHINCGWGGQGDFWYSLPVVDTHDAPIPGTEYYDIVGDVVYDICPYQGWYQYGADEKNSFYAIYAAPTADPPADKWQVEVPSNYHVTGLVVGTGNKIYASLSPKNLNQGYSPEIWVINQYGDMGKVEKYYITSEDNRVEYPVQNSNGEVFVATGEGGVYKIDTQTKNMVKIFQEPSGNALGIPKIDSDNRLYVNTNNDDKLYCLNTGGSELWPAPFDAPGSTKMYRGLPAIDIARNNVYIGYYDPSAEKSYLSCINRLDGTLRYQKTFDNILHGSWMTGVASIGSDGTVFVGCYDKLYALVPTGNSFTEHWVQQFDSKMADAIAIGKDGTLYASYWKQVSSTWYYAFGALYPANGDSKWEITIPSLGDYDNILQPYVTANNVIVFSILREQPGQDTFETYAYRDMGDHAEQLWHKDWETDSGGDVAFGPGATLYVLPTGGSWGGTIYAISEGDSGDPDGAGMSYTNNAGPSIPSNSVPTDGEQGLGATVILSWDCSDPEGHDPNYSVFVGESGYDMVPIAKDINENSYVLNGLKPNTGYAWKIITTDGQAVTEGPTWVFATKPPNPDLNGDGIVDLLDFAILAQCWVGSCSDPDWCEGRDLDWSGEVALSDLQILAEAWLAKLENPWPMFHHDLHLTGRSPYLGAQTNNLKWTFTTGGAIYSSPAIGTDGTIYVGSEDGNLYAIEPNGSPKWTYTTGDKVRSSPAIGSDGTIYFGSCDNKVYALNSDGTLKSGWPFTTGGDVDSSPSMGSDGTIYVGSDDHYLYAINPDGTAKGGNWPFSLEDIGDYHCPSIADDGTIYFASRNLHAINPNGTEKWSSWLGTYHYFSSAAIADDGTIYIGTRVTNYLHAINPENGDKVWSYPTGGWADLSPSIGSDGTIYIGSNENNKVHAVNPDGTAKAGWPFTAGGAVNGSPGIGGDGTIYIGSDDHKLYALNPDGSLKWSYTTGDIVRSSPAIGPDGTVYVGSYDGKLYAFGSAK